MHEALEREETAAYNLRGVLYEIEGDRYEAQQHYRKALELDPEYDPARDNVRRSVEPNAAGSYVLDALSKGKAREEGD